MILTVKNFGSIKKGKIDLDKKFTLFVGYNNSGKTYMAQLLWALSDFETIKSFSSYIEKKDIITKVFTKQSIEKILNQFSAFLEKEYIPIILNMDSKHSSINNISINFKITENDIKKILKLNSKKEITVLKILSNLFNINSFYLPSGRSSYSIFYYYIYQIEKQNKDEINSLVKSASEEEINFKELISKINSFQPSYTKAMNKLIEKLYKIQPNTKESLYYEDLVYDLKKLMGGEIVIKMPKEGIGKKEFYLSLDDGVEIPMYLVSSNSNQLLTLYLFFKYWANKKDNFLIIDEPEENLHPKNKIELTNMLIKFANRGNRVLVTTHSTMITDIVNNYICLSKLDDNDKEKIFNKYKIDKEYELDEKNIGIYFFNGEEIIEYNAFEYGVMFKDFLKEQNRVEDLSIEISDLLFEQYNKE